ncbi:MAG TPA: hypothetical protein VF529_04890, partial [Solirubrobacteraceae bacterium]
DSATGYGKLDLGAALAKPPPARDPLEPNEDFRFIDGRAYGHRARAIWTGRSPARLTALLDLFEDPSDVYRIRVPPHRTVRIRVRPRFGNTDLDVYAGGAPTVASDRGLIARSRHKGRRPDGARLRNRGTKTRTAYIQVYVRGRHPLDSRYTLSVR